MKRAAIWLHRASQYARDILAVILHLTALCYLKTETYQNYEAFPRNISLFIKSLLGYTPVSFRYISVSIAGMLDL